jgi:hypothetical protein
MQQLMQPARMIETEWMQILWGNMSMGAEEDESNTGCIWAAGFHHVMAFCRLVCILKLTNHLFL